MFVFDWGIKTIYKIFFGKVYRNIFGCKNLKYKELINIKLG